jgi:hypothetical protein
VSVTSYRSIQYKSYKGINNFLSKKQPWKKKQKAMKTWKKEDMERRKDDKNYPKRVLLRWTFETIHV